MSHMRLTKLIHDVVLESQKPAKVLAQEIGKPYSTLLREINPYDTGAKLGVETLFQIMKSTRNVEPLRFMADQMGFELTPKEGVEQVENAERRNYAASSLQDDTFPLTEGVIF